MLGRVEYLKIDMKDLPKANKLVTLDKQGDDGSLHPHWSTKNNFRF